MLRGEVLADRSAGGGGRNGNVVKKVHDGIQGVAAVKEARSESAGADGDEEAQEP